MTLQTFKRRSFHALAAGLFLGLTLALFAPDVATAQQAGGQATPQQQQQQQQSGGTLGPLPGVQLTQGGEDYALPIQLLLVLTILSIAPAIIILMTSFTRLVIVFSILRTALGLQQSPPSQVIIGLSIFLTIFIMNPVIQTVNDRALDPYLNGEITQRQALQEAKQPMKGFMLKETRDEDLLLFMDMAQVQTFQSPQEVPFYVLVPAFVISELRIAFQIGFMIFLPFLIVDLIVACVLMSMGMMMLPPVMISLPFKLLLFVLTDGWHLIVESVVRGYIS